MKKNIWKQLKKQNDGRQLNLEVPDQKYIDKVTAYAINQGVGMMETEIIRKDLIGIGFEAKRKENFWNKGWEMWGNLRESW